MGSCHGVVVSTAVVVSMAVMMPASSNAAAVSCHGRVATIVGTNGADTLRGTPGADVMVGLDGRDRIFGFGGNDLIWSGSNPFVVDRDDNPLTSWPTAVRQHDLRRKRPG